MSESSERPTDWPDGQEGGRRSLSTGPESGFGYLALPADQHEDDGNSVLSDMPGSGLTNLGFIRVALRRRLWLLCGMAVVGMLVGLAFLKAWPHAYQARTEVYIANAPDLTSGAPVLNDQAIALSMPVARAAVRKLGLHEDPVAFLGQYTVVAATDQVLLITANAPSSSAAVSAADAVASSFLAFQSYILENGNRLTNTALDAQIAQAQENVASLGAQISRVSAQQASEAQQAELSSLKTQRSQAESSLTALQQTVSASEASAQQSMTAEIKGAAVLYHAVPVAQHPKKRLLEYAGAGLVGGLVLGLAIVIIGALISDKIRRREDVSDLLRAPVQLSVGKVRLRRGAGLSAADTRAVRRMVKYLDSQVRAGDAAMPALAVIPADDVQVPAACLALLAISCAERGLHVVLADLCEAAPAATLLGSAEPGVHDVQVEGTHLHVAIADPEGPPPAGPLVAASGCSNGSGDLAAACTSADVLLTLARADPSVGADHLSGWATTAVVMVTAGRSSAERIYGIGEMIRHAGVSRVSAILVGAERTDESVGFAVGPAADAMAPSAARTAIRAASFNGVGSRVDGG